MLVLIAIYITRALCDYNNSMLWGSYRPNLYFGTRTRSIDTVMTGIMWFGINDLEDRYSLKNYSPWHNIRHTCEQDENIFGYAWQKHNGRDYGSQTITDILNNIIIKTEFIKKVRGSKGYYFIYIRGRLGRACYRDSC
jgi:mannosyl-oligosaccharide glucosidase